MRGVAYDPVFRAKLMALHQQGVPLTTLSAEFAVAREVLGRWWARYQAGDLEALRPQSRRPHHSPTRTSPAVARRILRLRTGRLSAVRIAHALGIGHSTVQRVLERGGASQLPRPPRPQPRRYEKQRPGELLHLDLKYLPALRNARHDFEFAAVDDFSREAVVAIHTDQPARWPPRFSSTSSPPCRIASRPSSPTTRLPLPCGMPFMRTG